MRRIATIVLAAGFALGGFAPALAQNSDQQTEARIGQQVYAQLAQKGEIVQNSPYYATLNPIAQRISAVADKQYDFPFHFILVNEKQPNAFSVPGGNVYVTTSMMQFAQNKEELAGVLCHEVSHDIHHDVLGEYQKNQRLQLYATGLALLLGGGRSMIANSVIGFAANIQSLKFSRSAEHDADMTGAQICAQAGLDPWGLVWLMQKFQASPTSNPPEVLSDHPSDSHRVEALENLFAGDPALFGRFNSNVAYATPLSYNGFKSQYKPGVTAGSSP